MSILGDVGIILATLAGPAVAVQVQKYLERRRTAQERRLSIFRALMSTRSARLSAQHVEALNLIDVEFYERKGWSFNENKPFKRVRSAWAAYLDNLCAPFPSDKSQEPVYLARRDELFNDMLYEMALALGYDDFDKTYIKNQRYMPKWFNDIETDQTTIRRGLADVLTGKQALPMNVTSFPYSAERPIESPTQVPPAQQQPL